MAILENLAISLRVIILEDDKKQRDPRCECDHSFNMHPIKSCMNAFCECTFYRPIKR